MTDMNLRLQNQTRGSRICDVTDTANALIKMALRPGSSGGGSFMYPVGGSLGPPQGMVPMQQQQQQGQQQQGQGFPMVQVMQPNMQSMMGMNFGGQMPPGAMPMQAGMAVGMQTPGMPYLAQPQFIGMRPAGPPYTADMQKQMAEEHQKRLEQQQKMLEEDRKRRQFEEQKQKLRLLSSVKPKAGEKSRDDALEAIKGNLDGFSREAKMHPTPSAQSKKSDSSSPSSSSSSSSSSHPSVAAPSLPPPLSEDNDEFSDFQGPAPSNPSNPSNPSYSSSSSSEHSSRQTVAAGLATAAFTEEDEEFSDFVQGPVGSAHSCLSSQVRPPLPPSSVSLPTAAPPHSAINSSCQTSFQGPSLEEKLFSSCDLTAGKTAHLNFKPRRTLTEMSPRARVSAQFQSSGKARNWTTSSRDLGLEAVFVTERIPQCTAAGPGVAPTAAEAPPQSAGDSGVGVYPQQEHIQSVPPAWLYNDSLIPEMFKKVLEFSMTPAGIDTAKLYPLLMSSGLPREALGQIWASANRTTPGMLTKEELYTVLALIGVAQSGLPAMNVEILGQFPSPPVPNLPALAMALAPVMPQHQQPMMSHPPVSMPMPMPTPPPPPVMPSMTAAAAPSNFASFPPAQGNKVEDDDFQDFQEAPKAGSGHQAFTDFQGEPSASFPAGIAAQHQNCAPAMLTPLSGSSSVPSDKYAVFKQLSVDQPAEVTPPTSDGGDKYSVFRHLENPADKKPLGERFADFKAVRTDDGFTDFKTADSVSPLEPSEQAKIFQPFPSAFPNSQSLQQQPPSAVSMTQKKNPLNMSDLDLFSPIAPSVLPASDTQTGALAPILVLPSGGAKASGRGEFALFGSSSSDAAQAPVAAPQDDFADFMAFGSSGGEAKSESGAAVHSETSSQQGSDKYDVFKQLSLEGSGGGLAYDDAKDGGDDFADFQSSKFCTALGASEKTLVDKVASFKQGKEDCASVKSLDLPSIGGSSAGKDDSEDALSVQLDMKLADVGGDLKHVMSDSSLDLTGLSSHQPPATEGDDTKFDPFGTSALSSLANYDWSERAECVAGDLRKAPPPPMPAEKAEANSEGTSAASPAKSASSFRAEDDKFEAFADLAGSEERDGEDDFGDFAGTVSEKPDSPVGPEATPGETSDDFGAFQGDKPKFGKSDFLKASAQPNVKSSEEMIKNELATFDLSVQGSHKRSHSLGEKEIGRSAPSLILEQPFRDRSSTLSEKPTLPVIRDKYKDLTGEVEESERYAYEWQRCLESALEVITKANDTLNGISSSSVCTEVILSAQGMEYLLGVVEVYRVTRRVELGVKATAVCSEKLQQLLKDISRVWNNLTSFMSLAKLVPDESSLDFASCVLRHGIKNAKELACGVCLLNVDSRSKALTPESVRRSTAFNSETDNFKLAYGGHRYHASCANFWINCVEPKPPGLILPDLL
ncbi:synergin gamma isoform X3 [Syngnathoides biaculeatus]|uniref:synergin gamma isoform X3 n=1 Tax=Syngnathoides biaculeatus TaxID=300417 RepID=UPI002ADDA9AE|nr:synergin gamma isoform X3 [Syngnathoides biaculeatus]